MSSTISEARMSNKAQAEVDEIVKEMVKRGYKVEAIHKRDHLPDRISVEGFGAWTTHYNDNLAMLLVGGWTSKSALVQLLKIILERGVKDA